MDLQKLLSLPDSRRDNTWEKNFLAQFGTSRVKIVNSQAQVGPDGWPYLLVRTDADATEPAAQIVSWLKERGIGLVVNSHKSFPDYIFTYGMIWNFSERGEFLSMPAPPDGKYLPTYVAGLVSEFLTKSGIQDPKVVVVGNPKDGYDLCFSLESLGEPPAHEHQGILQALAWFFPAHYSLVLASEKNLPKVFSLRSLV